MSDNKLRKTFVNKDFYTGKLLAINIMERHHKKFNDRQSVFARVAKKQGTKIKQIGGRKA